MVKEQEGKCFLCDRVGKLNIDHDHTTGHVRRLLCRNCNTNLGWFENKRAKVLAYTDPYQRELFWDRRVDGKDEPQQPEYW